MGEAGKAIKGRKGGGHLLYIFSRQKENLEGFRLGLACELEARWLEDFFFFISRSKRKQALGKLGFEENRPCKSFGGVSHPAAAREAPSDHVSSRCTGCKLDVSSEAVERVEC